MPSYEDVLALVRGTTPAYHLPVVYDFAPCCMAMAGGLPSLTRFYLDVEEKIHHQTTVQDLFPDALVLPGVFPDFGVVAEVSAFGGMLVWDERGAPYCHPVLRDLDEIDSLIPPVPGTTGLTAPLLMQKRMMRDRLREQGRELNRFTLSMGPAEISGLLLGYDKLFLGFYDDVRRIQALMEMITEFIIQWIRIQGEVTGGNEIIMVGDHMCSQVNAEFLHDLIAPCMKAIFDAFPREVKIYHNEGRHSDEHIELILRFGADVWHFGSDVHDIGDLYTRVGDDIVLFGGLDPHGCIRTGSPEEVRRQARTVRELAAGRRLLMSTGTGTTPDTSLENMRALVEVAAGKI